MALAWSEIAFCGATSMNEGLCLLYQAGVQAILFCPFVFAAPQAGDGGFI